MNAKHAQPIYFLALSRSAGKHEYPLLASLRYVDGNLGRGLGSQRQSSRTEEKTTSTPGYRTQITFAHPNNSNPRLESIPEGVVGALALVKMGEGMKTCDSECSHEFSAR